MTERREIEAFLDALGGVSPNAATACSGWTAHELVAHLTSGVEAIASQTEAHIEGREIPVFGSFAEREVAFWDVDDGRLRHRLIDGERRMTEGLLAIHRWDLVGDDDDGDEILARRELIDHSVRILSAPLLAAGLARDPCPGAPFTARIRSPREPDLVVEVGLAGSRLLLVDDDVDADVECDAGSSSPPPVRTVAGRCAARPNDTRFRVLGATYNDPVGLLSYRPVVPATSTSARQNWIGSVGRSGGRRGIPLD